MKKTLKNIEIQWFELPGAAQRQLIDAQAVFTAWEDAIRAAAEVRGSMIWRNTLSGDYLIRTSAAAAQKSLGPRSPETEEIYRRFMQRKSDAETRLATLKAKLVDHQKMNRALRVGRAPKLLIDILSRLAKAGLSEHFIVVGTHAMYAYEAAAGVFVTADALATQDIDLLWDTRKRLAFVTDMQRLDTSFLGVLRKVDPTFMLRHDQLYTAVNSEGFEVDVIRRESGGRDPHPLRMTEREGDDEGDFLAVQAERAEVLLSSPRFSQMVVATSGHMARMTTIAPLPFAAFKRWMAGRETRDPKKRQRDILQAEIVEALVQELLPHQA